MKTQTCHLYCFEYSNAWSSLEQSKKLQHFLLDRLTKFTSFDCLEQSQGFIEAATQIPVELPPPGYCFGSASQSLVVSQVIPAHTTLYIVYVLHNAIQWAACHKLWPCCHNTKHQILPQGWVDPRRSCEDSITDLRNIHQEIATCLPDNITSGI